MTLANALLIRYGGGHLYLDRSGPDRRRELYLEVGTIADRATAAGLGGRLLDLYEEARTTIGIEGPVLNLTHVPGYGFRLGDTIDGDLVTGYTATLQADGYAMVVPELGAAWAERLAALDRQIKRLGTGIVAEYAKPNIANPNGDGAGVDQTPPEFVVDGEVSPTFSPVWTAPRPWWCAALEVVVLSPSTLGPCRVRLLRLDRPDSVAIPATIATATLGVGQRRALVRVNDGWAAGEGLVVTVPTAGAGVTKLTATLHGAPV